MGFKTKTEIWEDTEFVRRGQIEAKQKQFKALIEITKIVGEFIEAAGTNGIPSGHLYAMLMGRMNIDTYNYIFGILKDAGVVTEQNHLLWWIGKITIPTI